MPVSIAYLIETLEAPDPDVTDDALNEAIRQAVGHAPRCLMPLPSMFDPKVGPQVMAGEYKAANYTGSLDAARTLLLPKHSLNINQTGEYSWLVTLFLREPALPGQRARRWEGEAATAERALCIAALKARVDLR